MTEHVRVRIPAEDDPYGYEDAIRIASDRTELSDAYLIARTAWRAGRLADAVWTRCIVAYSETEARVRR